MKTRDTRVRLVTVILLLVIVALGYVLVAKQRKEVRLRAALALFESRANAGIYDRLDFPINLSTTLRWADQASLEEVIAQIKLITNRPRFGGLRRGLPIQVDPTGLREASQSLASRVSVGPPTEEVSIQQLLRRILEPMGLAFQVKDGALTITSRQAVERSHESLLDRLDQPISLESADKAPLEVVLEQVRRSTRGPGYPAGLPIYWFAWTLQETIHRPSDDWIVAPLPKEELAVWEQLRRILEPLHVTYELRDGAIMIETRRAGDFAIPETNGRFE